MTLPTDLPLNIGTVLQDTYEVTALLGQGGMGAVFLARHRRLPGLQVAVKVLLQGANVNSELYARFHREASIATQLGHPHIVQVLDFNSLPDGTPYLIMEYLRGEGLEKRLQRGPLPVDQALALVRQVGSALQAAHRASIVHRDLKPANILLVPTESGGSVSEHAKLLDFGISKLLDSQTVQTQEAVLMGTPQYMSPEQAQGRNREIDARTDLFALGCITYEMLSGHSPFGSGSSAGSLVQVLYRIVHEPHEPLASRCPGLPPHVTSAVERALSKRPEDRHPDVAAFIAELTGTPLQSSSPPALAVLAPPPAEDVGFADTLAPSDTLRTPATGTTGLDATYVPSHTARPAATDTLGLGATYVPSSASANTARPAATDTLGLGATYVPSNAPPNTARTSLPPAMAAAASLAPTLRPEPAPTPPAVVPVAPAQPPPPARSKLPVAVGSVLLVLGVGAAGWWLSASRPSEPASSTPVAVAPPAPPPPQPPQPAATTPAEPAPAVPEPSPVSEPSAVSKPSPARAEPRPTAKAPASQAPAAQGLPENVKNDLTEAESQLANGDYSRVKVLANRHLNTFPRQFVPLLVRSQCLKGDLSNANAAWKSRNKIPRSEQQTLWKECTAMGIEMDPEP